jgi:hypothetical protein
MGILGIMLVFGTLFTGCKTEEEDSPSGGTFTLTGISAGHNNKYAIGMGLINDLPLMGAAEAPTSNTFKGVKIADGKVELPLFISDGSGFGPYSGGDTAANFSIMIAAGESIEMGASGITTVTFSSVAFDGGSAEKAYSAGTSNSSVISE